MAVLCGVPALSKNGQSMRVVVTTSSSPCRRPAE
jgi:hypothetical protein